MKGFGKEGAEKPTFLVGAVIAYVLMMIVLSFPKEFGLSAFVLASAEGHKADKGESLLLDVLVSQSTACSLKRESQLIDSHLRPVFPSAVLAVEQDLYFLDPQGLWLANGEGNRLERPHKIVCRRLLPVNGSVDGIPVQELSNFVFCQARKSLVILDKAGNLFEFSILEQRWRVLRANRPLTGSPDPEFMDLAIMHEDILVLDPERNQIWRLPISGKRVTCFFKQVLPWQLKPGMPNVSRGVSIAYSSVCYVLGVDGSITRYSDCQNGAPAVQIPFSWKLPKHVRPCRLIASPDGMLYVVERENNRVWTLGTSDGRLRQFVFPSGSDLRGLMPVRNGFFIVNGSLLVFRDFAHCNDLGDTQYPRRIDHRLDGLTLPIAGVKLPRHPGVWPGARRLYRYGVHKGMDFFEDTGVANRVAMGTPVRAVDGGKVVRADLDFVDMNAVTYAGVLRQCFIEHKTSDRNEDLLRGCQVWIDHGNGLITRYAHLSGVDNGIRVGSRVSRGDIIGYVGVSGTGQNLPGRVKHPHLHFEIWLDGRYLGWGLMPSETIGVFEDIFGHPNGK